MKAEKIAGRATADLVDDDPRIKVVLIMGAVNDNQLTIDQFRGRGWKSRIMKNHQHGTSVVELKETVPSI